MRQYVGYIRNWNQLPEMRELLKVNWILVDGRDGFCIFESDADLYDIKAAIGLDNIGSLCSVVRWSVSDQFESGALYPPGSMYENFYYKAIMYPKEKRDDFQDRSSVCVSWVYDEILVNR